MLDEQSLTVSGFLPRLLVCHTTTTSADRKALTRGFLYTAQVSFRRTP